jgi:hypothetical protein
MGIRLESGGGDATSSHTPKTDGDKPDSGQNPTWMSRPPETADGPDDEPEVSTEPDLQSPADERGRGPSGRQEHGGSRGDKDPHRAPHRISSDTVTPVDPPTEPAEDTIEAEAEPLVANVTVGRGRPRIRCGDGCVTEAAWYVPTTIDFHRDPHRVHGELRRRSQRGIRHRNTAVNGKLHTKHGAIS